MLARPSSAGRAGQAFELGESGVADGTTANSLAADRRGPRQDDQVVKTKPLMRSCLRIRMRGSWTNTSLLNRGTGPLQQPSTNAGLGRVGWHPCLSRRIRLTWHQTPEVLDVRRATLLTRLQRGGIAVFAHMDLSRLKRRTRGSSGIEQDPGHIAVPGGDDRPFVEAANSCTTRTVQHRDGWRPIQTTSGPLLLDGRGPNYHKSNAATKDTDLSVTPRTGARTGEQEGCRGCRTGGSFQPANDAV